MREVGSDDAVRHTRNEDRIGFGVGREVRDIGSAGDQTLAVDGDVVESAGVGIDGGQSQRAVGGDGRVRRHRGQSVAGAVADEQSADSRR